MSANVNVRNDQYAPTIQAVREQNPDVVLFIEVNSTWIKKLDQAFKSLFPYHFKAGGLAVWSRFPLTHSRSDALKSNTTSLITTVTKEQRSLQLIGIHSPIPIRLEYFSRRNHHLSQLSQFIQTQKQPLLVIGDFNMTPWSPYYRRLIQQTGLHNTQLGFGISPSYPSPSTLTKTPPWAASFVNIPIDHALVSKPIKVAKSYTVQHGNADHAALVTDLILP